MKKFVTLAFVVVAAFGITACGEKKDTLGDKVDKAIDEGGKEIDKAADKAK